MVAFAFSRFRGVHTFCCAAVLAEGLELYNQEENKSQIDAAIAAAGGMCRVHRHKYGASSTLEFRITGDQGKLMTTVTPLALTIGKPLLEKYGFTADAMGTSKWEELHLLFSIL